MASLPTDAPLLSPKSRRVQSARRLARRVSRTEARCFLVEGPQAVREALRTPECVAEIFAVSGAAVPHADLHRAALQAGIAWRLVDEAALTALAETVHPQGLVAVCRFLDRSLDDVLHDVVGDVPTEDSAGRPCLLCVCADVRDPGNAGTVLRCADAAGACAAVFTGRSVDPYNGKAVRASVGSLFHLPLVIHPDPREVVATLQRRGLTVLAADSGGELDLDDAIDDGLLARPTAWLFGNEAWGLPDELASLADHRVAIPIHGKAESLNLATAAALCLYASARAQRASH